MQPAARTLGFLGRLRLLVGTLVLLFLAAVAWTGWYDYRADLHQLGRFHVQLARAIATTMDRELAASATVLRTLAATPSLRAGDLEEFREVAQRVAEGHAGASISLFAPSGARLIHTHQPRGAPLPALALEPAAPVQGRLASSAAAGVRHAIERQTLYVSDLFVSLVDDAPTVALHFPIVQDAKVQYVLSLFISPKVFQDLLAEQRLPPETSASISDRSGATIARAGASEPFLARSISQDLRRAIAERTEGFGEGLTREGRDVLFAHATSPFSAWTAAIGTPRAVAFAPLRESALRLLSFAALMLALGLVLASWLARSVARPLDELAGAAEALRKGEPMSLPPMTGDFARLSGAMKAAELAIGEREHERMGRARAEARQLEAEEANRAKDRFLAMLSHELRNPLTAITNCVTLLQRGLPSEAPRWIDMLAFQTKQLRALVEDLIDLARAAHGKLRLRLQPVDLAEVALRVAAPYEAGGKAIQCVVHSPVFVLADTARVTQMVANLVENAVRYGGERTVVKISAHKPWGEITVEDDGKGIAPEAFSALFEPFRQGSAESSGPGLGLGLTLVRNLARAQGGEVSAGPGEGGRGARFTVRLPLGAPPAGKAAKPVARKILVVDDDEGLREATARVLKLEGHEVLTAADGREAIERIMQFRPDVALVDVKMAGMDGLEFARAVRDLRRGEAMKLVALSGYDDPTDRARALAAGFDAYLTKPASEAELQAVILD